MMYSDSNCRTHSIHYKLVRTIHFTSSWPPIGGLCHGEWCYFVTFNELDCIKGFKSITKFNCYGCQKAKMLIIRLFAGWIKILLLQHSLAWLLGFGANHSFCSLFKIGTIILRPDKYNDMYNTGKVICWCSCNLSSLTDNKLKLNV